MPRALLPLLLAVAALAWPASASAFRTGFADPAFTSPDPAVRADALDRVKREKGGVVRLFLFWGNAQPTRPASGTVPAAGELRMGNFDAAVRDARGRGLRVIVTITAAPRWAEGPSRPRSAPIGTWKPSPRYLAGFARAVARRYDGRQPDPANPGRALPAVRAWQIWNEPNLPNHLSPQWTRRKGRPVQFAAPHYRAMLSASAKAVKAVSRRNVVVAGNTAPYGDFTRGRYDRTPPVAFWRSLLCLNRKLRALRCATRARFDIAAHHPYGIEGPFDRAGNRDDMAVPDLGRLRRVLTAATKRKRVIPVRRKPLWVTEISWDSSPPDPDGVPARTFARWVEESLYVLWRQRVDTVTWFLIRDQAPRPSYDSTHQSGTYLLDGRPKLAARAFRFPFVARRYKRGRVLAWTRVPAGGTVRVEKRVGSRWVTVRRKRTRARGVVAVRLRVGGRPLMRARIAGESSLPYRVRG